MFLEASIHVSLNVQYLRFHKEPRTIIHISQAPTESARRSIVLQTQQERWKTIVRISQDAATQQWPRHYMPHITSGAFNESLTASNPSVDQSGGVSMNFVSKLHDYFPPKYAMNWTMQQNVIPVSSRAMQSQDLRTASPLEIHAASCIFDDPQGLAEPTVNTWLDY